MFLFFLLPLVLGQVTALVKEFPRMFSELQSYIKLLPQEYPSLLSEGSVNNLFNQATSEAAKFGQWVVSFSIESFPVFVTVLIYIVLVPILVFFFLKDRKLILNSLAGLLPREKKRARIRCISQIFILLGTSVYLTVRTCLLFVAYRCGTVQDFNLLSVIFDFKL